MEYPIISCIKDLTLATAAIITSSVAIYGLNTWKRQHVGQVEYDLARRLLKTSYEIRNAINQVRHPMMWSYEMIEPPEDEKNIQEKKKDTTVLLMHIKKDGKKFKTLPMTLIQIY